MGDMLDLLCGKKEKKVSLLKMIFGNPDNFIYTIKIIDGEIVVRIKPNTNEGAE